MIILNIQLNPMKTKRQEFLQTMPAILEAALQMEGCLEARCFSDIIKKDHFLIYILWDSPKRMKTYMESDSFKALMGMKVFLVSTPQIVAHYADEIKSRIDPAG